MSDETYLTPEELAQLKQVFYAQAKDMLAEFNDRALELEVSSEPTEVFRALERVVHTVKGDSMALEFTALTKLAHRIEDYLRGFREVVRVRRVRRDEIDMLLASGDLSTALLEAYCADPPKTVPDIEEFCERLVPPSEDAEVPPSTPETLRSTSDTPRSTPETLAQLTISFTSDCQMHSAGAFLVRQRLEKLGRFVHSEPDPDDAAIEASPRFIVYVASEANAKELRRAARVPGVTSRVVLKHVAASTLLSEQDSGDEPQDPGEGGSRPGPASSPNASASPSSSDSLRVEVAKIDRIMNLVGELVIGRSMVAQALADMSGNAIDGGVEDLLSGANGFLERTLTELQAAVLKIRMVPVEHVFKRFPRLVRDLAHSRGKKIELDIQGGRTELDKSIVDALGEPLLHLVRNAIDHGIETPEERSASGKAPKARLALSAFYEGNHAHVVVEDDGRGIDVAQVAQRAVTQGILEASQLDSLAPEEILNTIYQPGFSTADSVSDISGRGIGMDIVRESIENLKGVIELETAPGRGTRFLIRLPLTLAILRAVLVEVGTQTFAVPLTGVLEIIRLAPDQARTILGRGVLHWRNQVVPLVSLREALDVPSKNGDDRGAFVLLVGEAERRIGLVAERLVGEQELVVKPIEDVLTRSPGIAGASILGNGQVVLILHTRGLLDRTVSLARKVEALQ